MVHTTGMHVFLILNRLKLEMKKLNIDYDYRESTGQPIGFNTSVNMLNANIIQYFSNKKDMWLMLKAYDLFNQSVNTWRMYGENFIQDTKTNGLSRFLLISFNF